MSGHLLPHALLELTLARASARLDSLAYTSLRRSAVIIGRRHAHQQVMLQEAIYADYTAYESVDDRSLYARRGASQKARSALATGGLFPVSQDAPMTELERRIMELKETPEVEEAEMKEPSYTESELLSMYEELLAVTPRTQTQDVLVADREAQHQADDTALRVMVQSLYELDDSASVPSDIRSQYSAAITKLREIVGALESVRRPDTPPLDVPILATEEWLSLVRVCVREQDGAAAEAVIELMKRAGIPVPEEAVNATLDFYAERGDIANTERFLASYIGQSPSERQRHLHVKAHLKSITPRTFPTAALEVLHRYEERGLAAPQKTYTRVIHTLLSIRSAMAEAQAWDLFAHMRYVAHPTPDAFLYTAMIAACASRVLEPQPARALDLWTEMTVDKGIPPTADAYTAVIHACARSGEKPYVNEAFRLAKEMLDGHRDAYGNPAFRPDRKAFAALLEGAKRVGDLAKVRWILAEIVSESVQAARGDVDPVFVDEGIMVHVFHAYAAYKPPFKRSATVLIDKSAEPSVNTSSEGQPASASSKDSSPDGGSPSVTEHRALAEHSSQAQVPLAPRRTQFTRLLPQSNAEVLGETRSLFHRILRDVAPSALAAETAEQEGFVASMPPAFEHVRLTSRLLNAYISVHYMHGIFDDAIALYRTLFSKLDVQKDAWSYVEALERSARARRGPERKLALQFAREVWQEWQPVEDAWRRRLPLPRGVDARMVERAYSAMIRILSLTGNTREAVQLVRSFVERYPPDVVKHANPKPELRSTRVMLQAPRPLVRLLTPVEVPDDTVPPLLSFPEVEILHHRLVAVGDTENIRYLKWVCMSYAGALKRRKEATLRAEPVRQDHGAQSRIGMPEST
ncbi:hypothetical protein OH77DRAFT_1405482 [Trametes cingulata]|nr:hypothetical protein OH77DRAFT_1405482 [Trametes cingulata]